MRSALISVYYKEGLGPILTELHRLGVQLISTGGTHQFITQKGYSATDVGGLTGYPSILGGRVKTLHPKVFGGILGRTDDPQDAHEMAHHDIQPIDLVIVDLYPFEEVLKGSGTDEELIDKIDIGGVSLIRAAAKNHTRTAVISHRGQYAELLEALQKFGTEIPAETKRRWAGEAIRTTSLYDNLIADYLQGEMVSTDEPRKALRYGENPHQSAWFDGEIEAMFTQLHGKELSYNNLVDVDAALRLTEEFADPFFGIIKHTNPCGAAVGTDVLDAWNRALAADPVSAFGGVLCTNGTVTEKIAEAINEIFFEVLIAPDFTTEALEILKRKKNRIILERKAGMLSRILSKTILNGTLTQGDDDRKETIEELRHVTLREPTVMQIRDLLMANRLVKHAKSNAITIVHNGQLIGIGQGQTSRVDACRQAIGKATLYGFNSAGAAMASDAFFPFDDCVRLAHEAGIETIIQPGGSIKDSDSIEFCNSVGLAMVFTGVRHFRH